MQAHFAKMCFVAIMAIATASYRELEAADTSQPVQASGSLQNLGSDAVQILSQAPHVSNLKRHGPETRPTYRIVHLADWHFVHRDAYASDVRSLSEKPILDEEIERRYLAFLNEVERVQGQQIAVLRWLIKYQGLSQVYIEGATSRDTTIITARIQVLQDVGRQLKGLRQKRLELLSENDPSPSAEKIIAGIDQLELQYRRDLLQLGAAGQLMLSGELEGVLPLEDEEAYQNANPVSRNGGVNFDQKKIKARQDGQVRQLLQGRPLAVIVLGGAHDLGENLDRLTQGTAEYIRIEVEQWIEVGGHIEVK